MVVSAALVTGVALMGVAAIPHCAVMCATPCAAVAQGARQQAGFQTLRVLSYAAAGALAAASVGVLRESLQWSQTLRPLWTVVHAALLVLGLWLLLRGELPAWLGRVGHRSRPRRWAWSSGALWAAWPCGMLQAALLVAAMAEHPLGGALAMAAFAIASGPGLVWAPIWLKRLRGGRESSPAVRLAGAALTLAAIWALGHGLWLRLIEACFS